MDFRFGRQDWKTFERGEENCYLMTNGLGGFSSLSLVGSCSRNDQAVLMACLKSPNHRHNMIHRLEERLACGGENICLSSQDFVDKKRREQGFLLQDGFVFEDYPVWTYQTRGVQITRKIMLAQGENTVGILYEVSNRSGEAVSFTVTPHMEFVPKGSVMSAEKEFSFISEKYGAVIASDGLELHLITNGRIEEFPQRICEGLYYADDERDGRTARGRTAVNHSVGIEILPEKSEVLELVYSTAETDLHVCELEGKLRKYRAEMVSHAGFAAEPAKALVLAANQFLSHRESTKGWTILAGFPFFEDWGRDTMIALTGCCLSTGQFEAAKSILRTFASYCRKGLLPNLFPEGGEEPGYNTVDASLLFILAVREYFQRTKDKSLVEELFPVMEEIIRWYSQGTEYGIHMDEDGLLMAGEGYDQVTWMDVRIDDVLPTPRHGKPVEINAYWYNALRIMEEFSADERMVADYSFMAERVKNRFETLFWNEQEGCLKDVICGGPAENQVRCNQIWVVSLPFSLLPPEKEQTVVEAVYRRLYTPLGLRTLDPTDGEYHGFYGGSQKERDMAYHQGTVWTFPLGAYYLAYLKVHGYSREAKAAVREGLGLLEPALREGCVGQLPEIYDGDYPAVSKGCFAQAWSVGEILRVYEALGKDYV